MGTESGSDQALGPVALVGAGPGDPELLTLRAARLLGEADVILHDRLVSQKVLERVSANASVIDVGKRCGDPGDRGIQQQEIHDLMLFHSRRGSKVVRLKCGDPFVFGRGGEELLFLQSKGVDVQVVPGITSALGASASCHMPLTHRDLDVNQVQFVVGQCKAKMLPDINWTHIALEAKRQTTVIYMGFKSIDAICERLLREGAPPDMPMAIVESATTDNERVFQTTIADMPALALKHADEVTGPVLLILGPTVAFPSMLQESSHDQPTKRARIHPAEVT